MNAELLIDHAWGWEPCTIADVKAYKPASNSISSGQVLMSPYPSDKAKLVVREMTDILALDLVEKGLATDQLVLTVGYDIENLSDPERRRNYHGPVTTDHYGRSIPKHAHGTANLGKPTNSAKKLVEAVSKLYDRIIDKKLLARRITIAANHVIDEGTISKESAYEQLDLFTDYGAEQERHEKEEAELEREKRRQQAILAIKNKYGKNAILKGVNFEEGATAKSRNEQIGGHKA